jgi:uncharacterized protein YndB with AHSA1/START domain
MISAGVVLDGVPAFEAQLGVCHHARVQDPEGAGPAAARSAGGLEDDRVVATARARCSVEALWRALVDERGSWWPEMQFEAVAGARLSETWFEGGVECSASGTVISAIPPRELRFEWTEPSWPAGPSRVAITLQEDGTGASVTVEEIGLRAASGDPDLAAAHRDGWAGHLARLVEAACQPGA